MNSLSEAFGLVLSGDRELWTVVWASTRFSAASTFMALVPGIPLGVALGYCRGRRKRVLVSWVNAVAALPTVVIGLLVYSLISRSGPLGVLRLLFTPAGLILGQGLLALPISISLYATAMDKLDPRFAETLTTLGACPVRVFAATLRETRFSLTQVALGAFGRVLGEVGVSMMLGGNIKGFTRTLTTAIALETSKGDFERALGMGLVLMAMALGLNLGVHSLTQRGQ